MTKKTLIPVALLAAITFAGCGDSPTNEPQGSPIVIQSDCMDFRGLVERCVEDDEQVVAEGLRLEGSGDEAIVFLPREKDLVLRDFAISGHKRPITLDRPSCDCTVVLEDGMIVVRGEGRGLGALAAFPHPVDPRGSLVVQNVTFVGHHQAVFAAGLDDVVLREVVVERCKTHGIGLAAASVAIQDTRVFGCAGDAIGVRGSNHMEIQGTTVADSGIGLNATLRGSAVVQGLTARNNGHGVIFAGNQLSAHGLVLETNGPAARWAKTCPGGGICILRGQASVHASFIATNDGYGLFAASGVSAVDATRNWWGDPKGPRIGVEDTAIGASDGDAVSPEVAVVPWLDAPPTGAGDEV